MLVGNFTKYITQEMLQNNDIISGDNAQPAWGPLTLFRNTPVVNELFKLCPEPLERNLLNRGNVFFDEWGNNNMQKRFNFSMAGIIKNEGPRLGLRVSNFPHQKAIIRDKRECLFKYGNKDENIPAWCNECIYNKGKLILGRNGHEVLLCHFHASKKRPQHEESLKNKKKLENLVAMQRFRSGWQEGFDYVDTPEAQKLKTETEGTLQLSLIPFYQDHHRRINELANMSSLPIWETRGNFAYKAFYDALGYVYFAKRVKEPDLKASKYIFFPNICKAALAFTEHRNTEGAEPLPHVLIFRMNENWGGLSETIPGKTTNWVDNLERDWKNVGCTKEFIIEYLDHPDTLLAITTQFQKFYHPKVWSLPLGIRTEGQGKRWLEIIREPPVERTQLLMINSKSRRMRDHAVNKTIENFNGTVRNTYNIYGRARSFKEHQLEMKRSKFILSPGGLGLDCYRHYEALYMGTIPVLEHLNRTDGWYRNFDDLPVAWIDSYDNLTPEWLENEYIRITKNPQRYKYEKLTKQYWIDFIKSKVESAGTLASSSPRTSTTSNTGTGQEPADHGQAQAVASPLMRSTTLGSSTLLVARHS